MRRSRLPLAYLRENGPMVRDQQPDGWADPGKGGRWTAIPGQLAQHAESTEPSGWVTGRFRAGRLVADRRGRPVTMRRCPLTQRVCYLTEDGYLIAADALPTGILEQAPERQPHACRGRRFLSWMNGWITGWLARWMEGVSSRAAPRSDHPNRHPSSAAPRSRHSGCCDGTADRSDR
jgi:hypothetical protein